MTLRLRLVIAISLLVTVGLAIFGFTTYSLYSRSEYGRLDDQIRASAPLVETAAARGRRVCSDVGPAGGPSGSTATGAAATATAGPRPPGRRPPGTYGELRDRDGTHARARVADVELDVRRPSSRQIPPRPAGQHRFFTTGSATGSGDWRVYVDAGRAPAGGTVVVAVPLTEVTSSLNRLVLIEALAGGRPARPARASVPGSSCGAGLRPLEHMATSARSITAGDLSQRVEPGRRPHRGRPARPGAQHDARRDRGRVPRAGRTPSTRLRQFLADASHELRTPLTSIQGFAELFRLGADQDHVELAVILRRIEEETARMKVLVEDLLLLARLDETRPVERAPVDLAVLAADACSDAVAVDPEPARSRSTRPEPVVVARRPGPPAPGDREPGDQRVAPHARRPAIEVGRPARATAPRWSRVRDHGPGLDAGRAGARVRPLLAGRRRPGRVGRGAGALDRRRHRRRARGHGHARPTRRRRRRVHDPRCPLNAPVEPVSTH